MIIAGTQCYACFSEKICVPDHLQIAAKISSDIRLPWLECRIQVEQGIYSVKKKPVGIQIEFPAAFFYILNKILETTRHLKYTCWQIIKAYFTSLSCRIAGSWHTVHFGSING